MTVSGEFPAASFANIIEFCATGPASSALVLGRGCNEIAALLHELAAVTETQLTTTNHELACAVAPTAAEMEHCLLHARQVVFITSGDGRSLCRRAAGRAGYETVAELLVLPGFERPWNAVPRHRRALKLYADTDHRTSNFRRWMFVLRCLAGRDPDAGFVYHARRNDA